MTQTDPKQPFQKNWTDNFLEIIETLLVAAVAAVLILTLIFRTGFVSGQSMANTMHNNDRYIVSNLFYTPKAGDIVVFEPDPEQIGKAAGSEETLYVKRVIATEGQHLQIKKDETGNYAVYVDGKKLQEDYLDEWQTTLPNPYLSAQSTQDDLDIIVPEGQFFAMGDNRLNSKDSRIIGCIDNRRLVGKVLFRFYPFDKIGFIE